MSIINLSDLKDLLPDKAIPLLNEYIEANPDSDEAYTLRGMKYWALGKRALALKDYHRAIAINPDSDARQALSIANSILDFYNKDLYNP